MKWFGENWGGTVCSTSPQAETPDSKCIWCEEDFVEGDSGLLIPGMETDAPYHLDCFLRSVLGSLGHQQQKCSCFGGDEEDPPDVTLREAATMAVDHWRKNNVR